MREDEGDGNQSRESTRNSQTAMADLDRGACERGVQENQHRPEEPPVQYGVIDQVARNPEQRDQELNPKEESCTRTGIRLLQTTPGDQADDISNQQRRDKWIHFEEPVSNRFSRSDRGPVAGTRVAGFRIPAELHHRVALNLSG